MSRFMSMRSLDEVLGEEVGTVRTGLGHLKDKLGQLDLQIGTISTRAQLIEERVHQIRRDQDNFRDRVSRAARRIRKLKSILASYHS